MNDRRTTVSEGLDMSEMSGPDMQEAPAAHFVVTEEPPDTQKLEVHGHRHHHDAAHVDIHQEEYTPEEVAHIFGTSHEVIMHAIWSHQLRAQRRGRDVISITRPALIEWLKRRGSRT